MPTREELLDLFRRSGALLEGHFRLSSGLHSTGYLQCALVLQIPSDAERLGSAIASRASEIGRISSSANLRAVICQWRCSLLSAKSMVRS